MRLLDKTSEDRIGGISEEVTKSEDSSSQALLLRRLTKEPKKFIT
jgi:hypothetical protein